VTISLTSLVTGMIRIPLDVKITGQTLPTLLTLCATSVGPTVELSAKSIDFGKCAVLNNSKCQKLTLINKSPISVDYVLSIKKTNGIFYVDDMLGTIDANSTKTIKVMCCPDKIQTFTDVL